MADLPKLFFHDRSKTTTPVSEVEATALAATFGLSSTPTAADKSTAARLLMNLREREAWLACGCLPATVQPPPLMSPRLSHGQVVVVRHGATPHAPGCPFHVEKSEVAGDTTVRWKADWLRLRPEVEKAERKKSTPSESRAIEEKEPQASPLEKTLDTILETAGYNHIAPDDVRTLKDKPPVSARRDAYAALDRLRDTPIGGELKWGDVACSFLPGLSAHLKHLERMIDRFPDGTRPQGAFIGVVHEIEQASRFEHTLIWRSGKDNERVATATVYGPVHFGYASEARTGPYWVFAQLAQKPGEKRFVPVSAVAKPCLNKSVLLPVDSPRERRTAEMLLAQITYWAREAALGIQAQIEKPLHDEIAPDGTACRPDYVIWLPNGRRVLLEAVSEDKSMEYLKLKVRQHPAMRTLPNVVTLLAASPQDDAKILARRLTAVVARACGLDRQTEPDKA